MSLDYLVVGAGMFGCTFARCVAETGASVLVVDRLPYVGGNCYTEEVEGILVHRHGAHIFHTSDAEVWEFVNRFGRFNDYRHRIAVSYRGRTFSFPINLITLRQVWGVTSPEEAEEKLRSVRVPIDHPANLEEWAVSQVGRELYEIFIEGYTRKQWGRAPSELPASIVRRLPIRDTENDRYFSDLYEGIPEAGYTELCLAMLDHPGIRVEFGVDYLEHADDLRPAASRLVYSGRIDELFEYRYGPLEYRSLHFEDEVLDGDFQGIAIVNYTDVEVPYTRIIEHKHLALQASDRTVITYEYPRAFDGSAPPYYPVRDEAGLALYERYRADGAKSGMLFGGRLGTHAYYDMHQVVAQGISMARRETA